MSKRSASDVVEGRTHMSDGTAIKMSRYGGADRDAISKQDRRDTADVSTKEDTNDDDKVINKDYESKHTMESDDEEEEKYQRLNMDKVEGQEEATMDYDDNIKLTAFNMKEEEDDGHFDAMGNFVFDKNKEEIKDAWLDNIDWTRVKGNAGKQWDGKAGPSKDDAEKGLGDEDDGAEVEEDKEEEVDVIALYTSIMGHLKPNETVTKALKRLGGNISAADARKARWAAKKAKTVSTEVTPVALLTGLVDQLVATGEFEAYAYTPEKLNFEIEKRENLKSFTSAPKDATDDGLDMFDEAPPAKSVKTHSNSTPTGSAEQSANTLVGNVNWEFKWANEPTSKVMGPCTSQEMLDYQESGKFKEGVWVRKVGEANKEFYSSRRIDFDLYV